MFWKQKPARSEDPEATFAALSAGQRPDSLLDFPVETFLSRVQDAFPDAIREPNGRSEWLTWTSPNELEGFQVEWTGAHVLVTLRPLNGDRANKIVEIASALDAPLFDPQIGERFDSWLS